MNRIQQILQKYSYNEPYANQYGFEGSPYFHRGDEQLPFNQYIPLGESTMEKPIDLDRMENKGKDGEEFPEFTEFQKKREKRQKRLKELRKMLKENKELALEPAQFSPSQYSSMTGFEGMNAFTGGYYNATLGDNTDTLVNPWNDIYQSASNTSLEKIKLRSLFFNNFVKNSIYT